MNALLLAAVLCGQYEWIEQPEYDWIGPPSIQKETPRHDTPFDESDLSNPRFVLLESDCEPCLPEVYDCAAKLKRLGYSVFVRLVDRGARKQLGGLSDVTYRDSRGRWWSSAFESVPDFDELWRRSDAESRETAKESGPSRKPVSQSGVAGDVRYPTRGSLWTHPGSAKQHLLSGEHSGKFAKWWVDRLSNAEAESLHSDDHEGRVKWQYVNRVFPNASQPAKAVASKPAPVRYQSVCPTCPNYRPR